MHFLKAARKHVALGEARHKHTLDYVLKQLQ